MTCNSSIIKAINGHSNVVWSFYLMEPPAGTILSLLLSDNTTKWSYSRDETSVAPLRLGHIYDIQNCCSFWRLVWNLLFLLCNIKLSAASEWSTDGWIGKRLSFRLSGAFGVTRYQSSHILRPVSWCWSDFWLVRILNICFSLFVFLSADSFWWHQTNRKAAIVLFLMHLLKTGWNQIKYIRKYALV